MTNPTTPLAEIQKILHAIEHEETMGDILCKVDCGEMELLAKLLSYIRTLEKELADYKEVHADKQRLVRELDVVLFGEDGAAKQASLCDLIQPAANLRKWAEKWASDICMATEHAHCGLEGAREPMDALRHVVAALPEPETMLRVLKYLPPLQE